MKGTPLPTCPDCGKKLQFIAETGVGIKILETGEKTGLYSLYLCKTAYHHCAKDRTIFSQQKTFLAVPEEKTAEEISDQSWLKFAVWDLGTAIATGVPDQLEMHPAPLKREWGWLKKKYIEDMVRDAAEANSLAGEITLEEMNGYLNELVLRGKLGGNHKMAGHMKREEMRLPPRKARVSIQP